MIKGFYWFSNLFSFFNFHLGDIHQYCWNMRVIPHLHKNGCALVNQIRACDGPLQLQIYFSNNHDFSICPPGYNQIPLHYVRHIRLDTSDIYKYVGQSTCLCSVHLYWWKKQVSYQTRSSGSPHASKKECRQEIHTRFQTFEEGHLKYKTEAINGSKK